MPGIDCAGAAAATQEQRVLRVAELHAHRLFGLLQGGGDLVAERLRELAALGEEAVQNSVLIVNPAGTGRPSLAISAKLAPLPPSVFFIVASPSVPCGAKEIDEFRSHFAFLLRVRKKSPFLAAVVLRGNRVRQGNREVYQPPAGASRIGVGWLQISARTVDRHRESLMAKLNLHNRAALLKYAIQNGLLVNDG